MIRYAGLFAAIFLCAAAADQPAVGHIFDIDPGQVFRAWKLTGSGIGMNDTPYAVFELNGLTAALAFKNDATHVVRGFFVTADGIETRRWFLDPMYQCTEGED